MSTHRIPVVRSLSGDETQALRVRNNVGRIAFTFKGRVDIEPLHFDVAGASA